MLGEAIRVNTDEGICGRFRLSHLAEGAHRA